MIKRTDGKNEGNNLQSDVLLSSPNLNRRKQVKSNEEYMHVDVEP